MLTEQTAVARGDLTQKVVGVKVAGEILDLVNTINNMIDQLSSFAAEVTRVAREVGTEGKLGVQAEVGYIEGTWKDITSNVNTMATNLTSQVRAFAQISAAATDGDFTRFITVEASGEMDSLKTKINQWSTASVPPSRPTRRRGKTQRWPTSPSQSSSPICHTRSGGSSL